MKWDEVLPADNFCYLKKIVYKYKSSNMTIEEFREYVFQRKTLEGDEIMEFMNVMNDEARKLTSELNSSYHTQDEIREIFARLTARPLEPTLRIFPPFYTDFGKNITVGKNVFINACCNFQDHGGVSLGDGCLIGHNVVFATLNHELAPEKRSSMIPAPITVGRNVWVGSNSTILSGVTIGDNAVIAAGAVVTKDVEANTVVGGVPAKFIKRIEV